MDLEKQMNGFRLAQELNIDWWITSALESNVGLAAISQYVAQFNNVYASRFRDR